jgi:putative FmdB family regulatory protein
MPIYEYRCQGCGEKFEVIQKFSDEPLVTHESCGGKVERLIGSPALQFKGSGWYITDYAKSGGKDPSKTPAASGAGESKSSESKPAESKPTSESKPAAPSTPAK